MAETLASIRNAALEFLGDTGGTVWTQGEIEGYVQEGYDRMVALTECLFQITYLDDVAAQATYTLPSDLIKIDRFTWNWRRLPASHYSELTRIDRNFNIIQGQPLTWSNDQDGLMTLRKYPIPSAAGSAIAVTGTWGVARSMSATGTTGVSGTWGIPRKAGMGTTGSWGLPRRPYQDLTNSRLEYFRRGAALSAPTSTFEVPDRYALYLRWFCLWRSLERNGNGQDILLATHFRQRFEAGIARMVRRRDLVKRSQTFRLGGTTRDRVPVPLAQPPWNYARPLRYP